MMTDLPATTRGSLPAEREPALDRDLAVQVAATMQAAARSPHTRRAYTTAIGMFLHFLDASLNGGEPRLGLAESYTEGLATRWAFAGSVAVLRFVRPGHLDAFMANRADQGDSPNTASLRLAAVRTFLSVALRDGILEPVQGATLGLKPYRTRQKRDRKPAGRRLSKGEVRALRSAVDMETPKGVRDRAVLDCALFAALRCSEIAGLDMADLCQDRGRWWIVLTGKGQRTRKVKVHDVLWESLSTWLTLTKRGFGKGQGAVFVGVHKGGAIGSKGLNAASVNRLVGEYGAKAGLAPLHGKGRLGPHDLRRTAARNAYDNGAPVPQVQAWLGHSNITTTMSYIGTDEGDGGGAVDFVRYYTERE